MSTNSTDYDKRTCIICGCHSSQTINIYEPRSGPNIVQLIQARFKFQPLNDDKYLCYSCNNWLINWHSLQGLNTNNAECSSNTFRSSSLNNTKPQMSSTLDVSPKMNQFSKPVAIVKPRIRDESNQEPKDESIEKHEKRTNLQREVSRTNTTIYRRPGALQKSLAFTSDSKGCFKNPVSPVISINTLSQREQRSIKSQSCSKNSWNSVGRRISHQKLPEQSPQVALPYLPRQNQRSSIDGKVVSMLRRVGTSLSRDLQSASDTFQSTTAIPTRTPQTQQRDIDDDEILLNFDTAISEVLSYNEKKSSYDITNATSDTIVVDSSDDEDDISEDVPHPWETNVDSKIDLQQVFSLVPKGLTVSLVSN